MGNEIRSSRTGFLRREHVYKVDFFGGPLDGASIETDERPSCGEFVHRVNQRTYTYHYEFAEGCRFTAKFGPQAKESEHKNLLWASRFGRRHLLFGLLVIFAQVAAGLWFFLS
jgi:hypothetical protein